MAVTPSRLKVILDAMKTLSDTDLDALKQAVDGMGRERKRPWADKQGFGRRGTSGVPSTGPAR